MSTIAQLSHQMTTAPDSERLSGSGLLSRHSLASGSKHSTSDIVILKKKKEQIKAGK